MPDVVASGDVARRHTQFFIVFAVVFHAIYASSIFDIYFRSPVVHGMAPVRSELPAPARRVVLFVADGLRADRFYELISEGKAAGRRQEAAGRAEKHSRAPFLRRIIEQSGSWGVSHTRVPTESRPGHVALLAGLYEDLSSVTTGWETNPVTFDSVLNGSSHAWCFGSPDIVPMFSESLPPDRASVQVYSGDEQNMSPTERADKSYLDTWVFDRVRAMFRKATAERAAAKAEGGAPSTLVARLKRSQTVFFLHLLGIDTNGHAHRPGSAQYLHNIGVVDAGIKEMVEIMEAYFGDGRTAYVMTADHGMGSRGAHGDGHPENTRTPFVVWGAGVRGARRGEVDAEPAVADAHSADTAAQVRAAAGAAGSGASAQTRYLHETEARAALAAEGAEEEDAAQHWGLGSVARVDVLQADVAPLMASLAGLQLPLNSQGVLPIGVMAPGSTRAAAALANARQLLRQAAQKEALRRRASFSLLFRPSADLARGERELAALLQTADRLGLRTERAARDAEARAEASSDASRERAAALRGFEAGCMDAADAALRALLHYQHYDQPFLASVVVLGYAGWAILLLMQTAACGGHAGCGRALGDDGRSANRQPGLSLRTALREALPALACVSTLLFLDSAPLSHHVYVWFALGFWITLWRAFVRFSKSKAAPAGATGGATAGAGGPRRTALLHWALALVLVLGALESIVFAYSDGTYNRAVFSVCFSVMGAWPWYSRWCALSERTSAAVLRTVPTRGLSCWWTLSCCGVAIFPLLPIDPTAVQEEIVGGGAGGDGVGGLLGVHLDGDTMLAAGGISAIGMTALAVLSVWRERWRQQRQHEHKGRQQAEQHVHGRLLSMSESSVSVAGSAALVAQLVLCCCALWLALFGVTAAASHDPQRDARYQDYARAVALTAPCLTLFSDRHFAMRLLSIFAGLTPVYILLSVHYEVLFICTLACALGGWVLVEQRTSQAALRVLPRKALAAGRARPLMLEDMRTALFFLLFINVSFFATGNIASISSFELSSVYRFITKFSKFSMAALLVLKLLIPFFFVASAFGIIDRMTRLPPYCLYLLVFSMCDVLAIHIFFAVKTEGSWKEIGNSISHFVIINMFVLACPLMVWLSRIAFTNGALIPDTKLE